MPLQTPEGYRPLDVTNVADYLAGLPAADRLGGSPSEWRVEEVGDGNLNLVFIVEGPKAGLCVKQALPYVRLVGESWPLPLERAFFEHEALVIEERCTGRGLVPAVHHYDRKLYLTVMERLHPHIIMRRGMIQAIVYPRFAEHAAEFTAKSLFLTSDLALPAGEKKKLMATFCANVELCRITEDLIFTEPYMVAANNRWTSPQLDGAAAAIRADAALKRAISRLKVKFLSEAAALIHGDLHTGSIMVTETDTKFIDPEFAFFGPMGFDVGKLIGNLLMSYFSQDGHAAQTGTSRTHYQAWVLETAETLWSGFRERFLELWNEHHAGDAYPEPLFAGQPQSLEEAQTAYMRGLFEDSLGFAAASMIRRTLGLAHNIDFERIEDPELRALCERRNLTLARDLMINAARYADIRAVTGAARQVRGQEPSSLLGN
ncbi:MAG: S-methyl-5-thioribose kinase [Geminicoccaceae bacterium]